MEANVPHTMNRSATLTGGYATVIDFEAGVNPPACLPGRGFVASCLLESL